MPHSWARRPRDFGGHWSGKAAQRQPALALAAETEDNRCRRLLTHNANVDTLKLHLQAAGLACIKAAFKSPIFWYLVLLPLPLAPGVCYPAASSEKAELEEQPLQTPRVQQLNITSLGSHQDRCRMIHRPGNAAGA